MNNNWTISRRHVLKGAGATIALPFLEAMTCLGKGGSAPGGPPTRFACLYMPNGVYQENWKLKGEGGAEYELSPILSPLEDVREDVVPISNLDHAKVHNHHNPMINGYLAGGGEVTADLMIADRIGRTTKFPYLLLGVDPAFGGHTFICSTISRIKNRPLAPEIHPQRLFDRLFLGDSKEKARETASILDITLEQNKALLRRVGRADREKLDQYSTSIRSVERRLKRLTDPDPSQKWNSPSWDPDKLMARPEGIPDHKDQHTELMLDLLVLALWSDNTRVATMMLSNEFGGNGFTFLDGVTSDHHAVSHHKGKEDAIKQYTTMGQWFVAKLRSLIVKMKEVDEGGSTLLDNSLILFGSCMGEGMRHTRENLPIVLAGKAGGRLGAGRHLVEKPDTPHDNMLLTVLQTMGLEQEKFGSSTGTLHL